MVFSNEEVFAHLQRVLTQIMEALTPGPSP